MIHQHIQSLPAELNDSSWAEKLDYLFREQIKNWPMAQTHYRQFESVEKRSLRFEGFRIDLQYNPARARSTCADLSQAAIANRRCFLCAENLPEKQQGLIMHDQYLLLVNPFPIFGRHFTLADIHHVPQNIRGRMHDLLLVARELEGFTVFYNGPYCGASAPDHFHFQVVPFGEMPIDNEIRDLKPSLLISDEDQVQVFKLPNYLRTAIVFESVDAEKIDVRFGKLIEQLPFHAESNEPMMNLLATYFNGQYRLVVFPRRAQRPSCYFREGHDRLVVSPASVELGGVVVTPREEDFRKITNHDLIEIFDEVSFF